LKAYNRKGHHITKEKVSSIEDFIRLRYPPPTEGSNDYRFYESWGYDQWLIKTYKYSLEQLCITERSAYEAFRIALDKGDRTSAEYKIGKRIVRAKRRLERFLCSPCEEGDPGLLLWEEDGGYFCAMGGRGWFPTIVGLLTEEDVELTDTVFESDEQLYELAGIEKHE